MGPQIQGKALAEQGWPTARSWPKADAKPDAPDVLIGAGQWPLRLRAAPALTPEAAMRVGRAPNLQQPDGKFRNE